MSAEIPTKLSKRGFFILFLFLIIVVLLGFALFKLQIMSYDEYQLYVIDQMTVETNVNPLRGKIYDSSGRVLATNKTVWVLYLCPKNINDADFIAKNLSEITGLDYESVFKKAENKSYKYQILTNSLEKDITDKIRKFIDKYSLEDQIKLNASSKRYYPYSDLASHTLGFINADGVGIYGLEKVYNNILEGTNGRYITAQDAKSNDMPFKYEEYVEDEGGYNLKTTLDYYIQHQLETQLEQAAIEAGARNRATGIVMNPKTGEIYAMATYPSFDLNSPYTLDSISQAKLNQYDIGTKEYKKQYLNLLFEMWNNKAVTELYEPGSTFKLVTTSVALQENAASLSTTFTCTGSLKIEGYYRAISCHKRKGHGTINFAEALQQSCNPAMMTLSMRVGRERFYNYFKEFGYTEKTNIDLPSEALGYYHPYDNFSGVSLAVYSFGQTFKTTAIQQLRAVCAVANGGYLVTPHLIDSIVDDEGNTIYKYESKSTKQIIDSQVSSTISEILMEGVNGEGGAKNAYVAGYKIAAKTGTSEKKDKYDTSGNTSYRVSSCIAYAPSDDAQVAVIFIVDEPSVGSAYGSVVAAPYVSKLMESILPYMGIEPEYGENDKENEKVLINDYTGKSIEEIAQELKNEGISYEIIGKGESVVSQIPQKGNYIYKSRGKVLLYTSKNEEEVSYTEVPDLIGKSPQQANVLLSHYGLNIMISGSTNYKVGDSVKVVYQYPAAGTSIKAGEVVTIKLIHTDIEE